MTVGINFFSGIPFFITGAMYPAGAGFAYSKPALTLNGAYSGGGVWALGSGIPSWLTVNATTGAFTGTAPPYKMGINRTSYLLPARAGVAYSSAAFSLYGSTGGGGTWSLGAGAPAWLIINATTGAFSGSP